MNKRAILIAVAVSSIAVSARAQFMVNNGNAADANTRAGSYGSNNGGDRPINSALVNGNQIVTGNVTGGRALQTNPGYFAPGQLETNTGTEQFQDFIRDSTGVPAPYQQTQPGYVGATPFYGGATTAAPPQGYVRNSITGAYVPNAPAAPQMNYNTQVGVPNPNGLPVADIGLTPNPGTVQPTTAVSGAELYGPRPEGNGDIDAFYSAYRQWNPADRDQLSQNALQQMRNEISAQPDNANSQNNSNNPNSNNPTNPNGTPTVGVTPGSLNPPSVATQLANQNNSQANPNNLNNPQQPSVALQTPAQQSTEYAELQQRFNAAQAATNSGAGTALPGTNTQTTDNNTPSRADTPEEIAHKRSELYPPSMPSSSPLLIHSLAVGIHARGLRDVMADAEEHMRQGHFAEAMLRYAAAADVAPNNPLVALGRSYAELGSGYYARAAHDLRIALQADPVLLMGRYDLKNLLGENRLEFIVRDLKQIATNDKQNVDAPFLLAYIAYNNDSASAAQQYLDLAEQRSGSHPAVMGLMRQYWGLTAAKK
jgi:tetratricopeptide (TPR) repeat protein